jgi:hypothetical protein
MRCVDRGAAVGGGALGAGERPDYMSGCLLDGLPAVRTVISWAAGLGAEIPRLAGYVRNAATRRDVIGLRSTHR